MRVEKKAQKIINELTANLIRGETEINAEINVKLALLESTLIDYFNAKEYIQKNGYIQSFNKGTSIGLSPMIKLKQDSAKLIIKILKELKEIKEIEDDAFINDIILNG